MYIWGDFDFTGLLYAGQENVEHCSAVVVLCAAPFTSALFVLVICVLAI